MLGGGGMVTARAPFRVTCTSGYPRSLSVSAIISSVPLAAPTTNTGRMTCFNPIIWGRVNNAAAHGHRSGSNCGRLVGSSMPKIERRPRLASEPPRRSWAFPSGAQQRQMRNTPFRQAWFLVSMTIVIGSCRPSGNPGAPPDRAYGRL